MTILSKIKSHSDAGGYFKELPFYNIPIEKPKVKRLKTLIDFTPFYEQLSVIKMKLLNGRQCRAKLK